MAISFRIIIVLYIFVFYFFDSVGGREDRRTVDREE
jgi:hypothetical protein